MSVDNQQILWLILFFVILPVGVIILVVVNNAAKRKAWREAIYAKYGRTEIAERILGKVIWVGETADQLHDSLGRPADIDEKVLKTKRKEIWKYYHRGANRYGLRITVENGEVVGWDEKL